MGFAKRYGIRPLLMGLMVINGGTAGGFSPLSIFGTITNQVVVRNDLPGSPVLLFLASFAFNVVLALVCFAMFGGRDLLGKKDTGCGLEDTGSRGGTGAAKMPETPRNDPARRAARRSVQTTMVKDEEAEGQVTTLDRNRIITLIGLIVLAIAVVPRFNQDVGFTAICIAVAISSSVVDSSPFSTSRALVVANSLEDQRDRVFKQLMVWGFSMVVIAPIVTWLLFVVPGWG